ncbi:MAG: UDP-N-acetylmuramoyl-L-alanyl-D-glutamate--2,6-diaminopimelate ligase [Anaerolineales bacterium]|nr:UDP-N-acetylmuramoyl-L-alanyl-D-glutamate--2,6-diaminopimelate ligase [Anaerolineales bacterium]
MDELISLFELFDGMPVAVFSAIESVQIGGVKADSRQVRPGDLFVALRGGNVDGHRFIPQAVANGAAAVVGTEAEREVDVPYVQVADSRQALAYLAAAFYRHPARRLCMIGVTGTDGKTTTVNLIYTILRQAGIRAGMISTVNAVIGEHALDTGFHVTTPDAPDVQRYLAMMVDAGLTHAVLETTSHGWAQNRVDACEFDIGVVTNITHEHLDEHGSYENYRAAKGRLFRSLAETKPKAKPILPLAVLNRDDISYDYLAALAQVCQVSYGFVAQADLRALDVEQRPEGMYFTLQGADLSLPIRSNLVGAFNISNCLAAIAATVKGLGVQPLAAQAGIAALAGVPGRMERIDLGQDFTALVDFAHTPNALRRALETARTLTQGRVIVAFGSAGLRDREKRRMMAETAIELADLSILTAEDPRTESLDDILAEMARGAESRNGVEGDTFWRIPDRGDAIRKAIALAKAGDVVMACGKGHEQSMCFGVTEHLWDDRIAMRAALAEHLGVDGPQMPWLPTTGK